MSLSEDTGELQHYSDRVNTFLSLSTSRVLGLDEGGTFGTNGELYTGAGVNSESYIDENGTTDIALNTILYGPPGTGKTYHTVIYAVAIIENRELASVEAEDYPDVLHRYNEYKAQGRVEFTTFHQSYGYEEFIEGIKPSVDSEEESGDIQYSVQPGVFKRFCERADCPAAANAETYGIRENPNIWKVSLWSAGDNEIRSECLSGGHIRIGWDQYGKDITDEIDFSEDGGRVVLNAFINRMQVGDIVVSCYSASTIDAIGVVTGDYEWHEEYEYFRRLRKVNWIVKGMQENMPILQYSHEIRSAVLLIHGEKAHSCYFSRDAFEKLTGDNKELLIIPGAVHTDLYDRLDVIPFDKMESFFRQYMG